MSGPEAIPKVDLEALAARLRSDRDEWEHRLGAIQRDRRRQTTPLDPDFGEQAVQRENDDALDALDERGRQAIAAIDAALSRLAAGSFGICARCGETIARERLEAQPTAAACVTCS